MRKVAAFFEMSGLGFSSCATFMSRLSDVRYSREVFAFHVVLGREHDVLVRPERLGGVLKRGSVLGHGREHDILFRPERLGGVPERG